MEVTAVLDLLQHLHLINVKKMYNQDINKISSAINFTKTVRGRLVWISTNEPLQCFIVNKQKADKRIFPENKLLINALPDILFYSHQGHTYATLDLESEQMIRISSDLFSGYLPPESFVSCDQESLSIHDYRTSDTERMLQLNMEQLNKMVPKFLGPQIAKEIKSNFQRIIIQVQNKLETRNKLRSSKIK